MDEKLSKMESLVNSNDKIDSEKINELFENKENLNELKEDLKAYINRNADPFNMPHEVNELKFINNDDEFEFYFSEFRLCSREAIISKNNKLLFIIRQEELYSVINTLQKKLEEYDNYVKENGEDAAAKEYTNSQLNEIHIIRNQSIPMYLVELETLSSAVRDNDENYDNNHRKAFEYAEMMLIYINSR